MANELSIHTDGGARGNPGPAALGVTIEGFGALREYGEYLGETTNNVAEYRAVIFALEKARHLLGKEKAKETKVTVYADSELLVRQLGGQYKIKDEKIQRLFLTLWNLRLDFKSVEFIHVPREQNKGADKMVNQILDKEASKIL